MQNSSFSLWNSCADLWPLNLLWKLTFLLLTSCLFSPLNLCCPSKCDLHNKKNTENLFLNWGKTAESTSDSLNVTCIIFSLPPVASAGPPGATQGETFLSFLIHLHVKLFKMEHRLQVCFSHWCHNTHRSVECTALTQKSTSWLSSCVAWVLITARCGLYSSLLSESWLRLWSWWLVCVFQRAILTSEEQEDFEVRPSACCWSPLHCDRV